MSKQDQKINLHKFWKVIRQQWQAYTNLKISEIETFDQVVVQELPNVGKSKTLYFIPSSNPEQGNTYDEFIYTSTGWEQVGSTAYVPDHTIDTTSLQGKVVITKDERSFAVNAEEIVKPATPTLPTGGDFYNSKFITIKAASGAVIYYTTDGSTPTTASTLYTSAFTIGSLAVQSTSYTINAIAVKNGMTSDVASQTYTCYRRVATPTATASGNKYSASRTITLACTTENATIEYKVGGGEWTEGSSVTINATSTVYFRAKKSNWVTSEEGSEEYTLNANMCYIGQAASVTTEVNIKSLANSYERDTLVGWTAPTIDFGSTTEYVWFAIPSTAAKNLTINSSGFGVTLDNVAGTVIGSYRVWRTAKKINSSFTFEFI